MKRTSRQPKTGIIRENGKFEAWLDGELLGVFDGPADALVALDMARQ